MTKQDRFTAVLAGVCAIAALAMPMEAHADPNNAVGTWGAPSTPDPLP